MPSDLGRAVRKARNEKGISLRELARRVKKSPSFLSTVENADEAPAISEDTLTSLEEVLGLTSYSLVTLAGRTPDEFTPTDEVEVELYRQVKRRSPEKQRELLEELRRRED